MFDAAIDSIEKGLQDAFMLVFDSLTTEMDDFNDQLKELGRGVIRTIQESLTQEFLVKPLMEKIGDVFDFGEVDLASKIELALRYGGDDLAGKIQRALGGGVPPTASGYAPSMSGNVPPGGFTSYYQDPAGSIPMANGVGAIEPPKLDIEAQKEAQEANTSALDNLTAETGVQIGALGTVLAGLTGNKEAAEKLALITAGFKAYQMAADLWKKLFGVKEQTSTMLLIAAIEKNTLAQSGSLIGGKTGGVFSGGAKMAGYSSGGVARGSRAGYPVELHGTEAVVPLPNGRSIPVEMSGGAGQQNNVTVNVAVDNQGGATSSTGGISGDQAAKFGNAISEAVKKELLNQKRPGGMLSPYGVA